LRLAESQLHRSRLLLEELRKKWGDDTFDTYVARPDVKYWLAATTFSSTAN
jgi:hypothetical protein